MTISNPGTSGEIRLQMYGYVSGILGRELSVPEHDEIKRIMSLYSKLERPVQHNPGKVTHEYICKQCKSQKMAVGHSSHKSMEKRLGIRKPQAAQ